MVVVGELCVAAHEGGLLLCAWVGRHLAALHADGLVENREGPALVVVVDAGLAPDGDALGDNGVAEDSSLLASEGCRCEGEDVAVASVLWCGSLGRAWVVVRRVDVLPECNGACVRKDAVPNSGVAVEACGIALLLGGVGRLVRRTDALPVVPTRLVLTTVAERTVACRHCAQGSERRGVALASWRPLAKGARRVRIPTHRVVPGEAPGWIQWACSRGAWCVQLCALWGAWRAGVVVAVEGGVVAQGD